VRKGIVLFILGAVIFVLSPQSSALPLQGVWIDVRSIPTTHEGIQELVERLKQAHCNVLFVESFYRGETIYPSRFLKEQGCPQQMATFDSAGLDPLGVFIDEAHHHGMQVHAWFDMFYVGLDEPGPLLSRFPEWATRGRDGNPGYVQGGRRFFFLCPLHPGVLEFFKGLLGEVVRNYNLDGVHLDYFRFPDPVVFDACYCDTCRKAFTERYGQDPLRLDPLNTFEEYKNWVTFRAEGLTEFAEELTAYLRTIRPDVFLSCAVKPSGFPLEGYPGFLQDWPSWGRKGLFDFLIPMTYSSRPAEFEGLLVWIRTFAKETPFAAGVWCAGMNAETIAEEIQRAKRHTPLGVVLFAYPYLSDEILAFLAQNAFTEPSQAISREDYHRAPLPLSPQDFLAHRRTIVARRVKDPILVDGVLETAWESADWQKGFAHLVEGQPKNDTHVAVLFDQENLYVAYLLEGEASEGTITQKDGPVFYDDSVELFLDPWLSRSFFVQLATNLLGTQYDASSLFGSRFDGTWHVAIGKREGKTIVEFGIPFTTLGRTTPQREERWGVNFCRNNIALQEFSTWSRMPGIYGAAFFFGDLVFRP